jgi:hypothetical protein
VHGTSGSDVGVGGFTEGGFAGVAGVASIGRGVRGVGGVIGVEGVATEALGGAFTGGLAPLLLVPSGAPGAPSSGLHSAGELRPDSSGVLWYCSAGGTPGTWVRLTGVRSGTPGGALNYLPAPIRLYDTRGGTNAPLPAVKGALAGNSNTTIQVTGTTVNGISVPAGATGIFGNLTVTNTQGAGDLILWPHGAPQPNASNINYGLGQTVANAANVGLSAGGVMDLFVHVSGTDVILDIAGFVL